MNNEELLYYIIDLLKKKGADKVQCRLEKAEVNELNVENFETNLLRTTFNNKLDIKIITDNKKGSISTNKLDKENLEKIACDVIELSKNSEIDNAYDIADKQQHKDFTFGEKEPDIKLMQDSLNKYLTLLKSDYKYALLDTTILDFTKSESVIINSNDVNFKVQKGYYGFSTMFSSKKDKDSSSFNYTSHITKKLNKNLIEYSDLKNLLKQSEEHIYPKKIGDKFIGELIITPHCSNDILSYIYGVISDYYMISGSSPLKEKLGEQVISPLLTVHSKPLSEDLGFNYFITGDGFEAKDSTLIDKGILKTFLLTQYGAKKTGKLKAINDGGCIITESGETKLDDMIKSVKRGVLLYRISGGNPSDNGDFSFVAKNSYYIENGKIQYPIIETMISGNILTLLNSIDAVSKEQINFGDNINPWIKATDVNISG